MGRAPCCEKVGLKRGRWTAEEDEILANYIRENGEGSWRSLPKNAGLLRCGKSCRLRWINYLRADLKRGNICAAEEETIIKLHASLGNRWSLIAAHLPGRTDNEIKNYWNSHLSRRIHTFRRINADGAPVIMDPGKVVGGYKRRGGRKSRSAMKKTNSTAGGIAVVVVPTASGREKPDKGVSALPTTRSQSEVRKGPQAPAPHQHSEVTSDGPNWEVEGMQSGVVHSAFWGAGEDMQGGILVSSEVSGGWGSRDERDSGATSSLTDDRDSTGLMNEDTGGGGGGGGCGVKVSREEEEEEENRIVQMEKWVDLELEGLDGKLWDDVGEMWPWLWGGENGEPEFQSMEGSCGGYLPETFDSWLLSDM